MEEILFSVRYEETEELGLLNLERIDSIFQKPSFNGLQRVIFVMNGPLDDQMDKEDIKRRMRGLTHRKLLVFQ